MHEANRTSSHSITPENLLAYEPFVRSLARRLVTVDADAEDVVQETWIRALGALGSTEQGRSVAAPKSWLARVVRNVTTDLRRRNASRSARERDAVEPAVATGPTERGRVVESVDESAARLESHQRLVQAVLALGEPYRDVVLLTHFQGLRPREVAKRLERSPETVRSQLHRAHEKLRLKLDGEYGGDRAVWAALLLPTGVGAPASVGSAGLLLGAVALTAAALLAVILVPRWSEDRSAEVGGTSELSGAVIDPPGDVVESAAGLAADEVRPERSLAAGARVQLAGYAGDPTRITVWAIDPAHLDVAAIEREPELEYDPFLLAARFGRSVRADEEGLATITGLRPDWALIAEGPGLFGAGPAGEPIDGVHHLEVAPAEDVTALVVDETDAPIAGVPVSMLAEYGEDNALDLMTVKTGPDGRARFVGFGGLLTFDEPTELSYSLRLVVPGAMSDHPVDARPGEPELVRLSAPPYAPVSVHIVDAAGEPLAVDGSVRIHELAWQNATSARGILETGVASFAAVAVGAEVKVTVSLPATGQQWEQVVAGPARAGEAQRLELGVPSTPSLTARILDESGEPVAGRKLHASIRSVEQQQHQLTPVKTSADGKLTVALAEDVPLDEPLTLTVIEYALSLPARRADTGAVDAPRVGGVHDLGDLTLRPMIGKLTGICVDREGNPMPGIDLQVQLETRLAYSGFGTDEDGAFEVTGLIASDPDFETGYQSPEWVVLDATPAADDASFFTVRVARGGKIAGSLILSEEIRASNLWALAFRADPNAQDGLERESAIQLDTASRAFELSGLPAGEYTVRFTCNGRQHLTVEGVHVAVEETARPALLQDIDLRDVVRTIRVTALDSNGDPLRASCQLLVDGKIVDYHNFRDEGQPTLSAPRDMETLLVVQVPGKGEATLVNPPENAVVTIGGGLEVTLFADASLDLTQGDKTATLTLVLEDSKIPGYAPSVHVPSDIATEGQAAVRFPVPGRYRLHVSVSQPAGGGLHMAGMANPVPGDFTLLVRSGDSDGSLTLRLPESAFE